MKTKKYNTDKGSSLIAVIIITVVSITVIGAMVILVSIVLLSTVGWQKSADALFVAESYADDYLLRLIRDPSLVVSPNDEFILNSSSAKATIYKGNGALPNILFIRGTSGSYSRLIRLVYTSENGKIDVLDRKEVVD
ncbi:MAG: hypothetical protein U0525_01915 [Patescibacteria group bacterium]